MRSSERAQDLGEVFTPHSVVSSMLDMIPNAVANSAFKALEPACGDGNFLVEILGRRLEEIDANFMSESQFGLSVIKCVSGLYGVDIDETNVSDCRERLQDCLSNFLATKTHPQSEALLQSAQAIIRTNVVVGDTINSPTEIVLIEYTPGEDGFFTRTHFFLEEPERDLFFVELPTLEPMHFLRVE